MDKHVFVWFDENFVEMNRTTELPFENEISDFLGGQASQKLVKLSSTLFDSSGNRDEIQKIFGFHHDRNFYMYHLTYGMIEGKPLNPLATRALGTPIYGKVIIQCTNSTNFKIQKKKDSKEQE